MPRLKFTRYGYRLMDAEGNTTSSAPGNWETREEAQASLDWMLENGHGPGEVTEFECGEDDEEWAARLLKNVVGLHPNEPCSESLREEIEEYLRESIYGW